MEQKVAFLDESGDPFKGDKASELFVVAAVIVRSEDFDEFKVRGAAVRANHFGPGEIKSSGIKKKKEWTRRSRILRDLATLPFQAELVCIQKGRLLPGTGLDYKRSFIKFCYAQLYQRLFLAHPALEVFADEHGSDEFMAGFRRYIQDLREPTFFSRYDVQFVKSHEVVGVQVADFLAGTYRKAIKLRRDERLKEVSSILEEQNPVVTSWPPVRVVEGVPPPQSATKVEHEIRDYAIRAARRFLNQNERPRRRDWELKARSAALERILFEVESLGETNYVPSHEIIEHVAGATGQVLKKPILRRAVIGPLRDAGVPIVSSSSGYKLPVNREEVRIFVELATTRVVPLLGRIGGLRKGLLSATEGDTDILKGSSLAPLSNALEEWGAPTKPPEGRIMLFPTDTTSPGEREDCVPSSHAPALAEVRELGHDQT